MLDFSQDRQPGAIPDGKYTLLIMEAKIEEDGGRQWASLKFKVKEIGDNMFQRFWLQHPNEMATKIGRGQFKGLLLATGLTEEQLKAFDPAKMYEIVGAEVSAKVKTKQDEYMRPEASQFKKVTEELSQPATTDSGNVPF